MLKLSLQRALGPASLKLRSGVPLAPAVATAARLPGIEPNAPSRRMGTHGRNEPSEPLNSPKRAKEFIYRLQPKERTCLLKELQSFESIAIAQGERAAGQRSRGSSEAVWKHTKETDTRDEPIFHIFTT